MRVEKAEILKLAKLARLEFSDAEIEKLGDSLGDLVGMLDTLKQLKLDNVEPMTAVDSSPRPLRPDVEQPMLPKEKALANAPEVNLEHFSIPKVIGG
jgi:aspartyl-tRNA(Asn)/glutamyl-tRNA(Gln) amidotransferase subunit C